VTAATRSARRHHVQTPRGRQLPQPRILPGEEL